MATNYSLELHRRRKLKDTTLVEFEHAKLDIWGYKDDYLQPMQLKNADKDAKKSYLTVIDIFNSDPKDCSINGYQTYQMPALSMKVIPILYLPLQIMETELPSQWSGSASRDYYLVDVKTGQRKKIIEELKWLCHSFSCRKLCALL